MPKNKNVKKAVVLTLALSLLLGLPVVGARAATAPNPDVAVYFDQWGIYEEGVAPADMYWGNITTVNHAFWEIVPPEDVMALLAKHTGRSFNAAAWTNDGDEPYTIRSCDALTDFGGLIDDVDVPFEYEGHFTAYERLCKMYPDVNVLISVGGWTRSGCFSLMSYKAETRKTFIDSCIDTLQKYPFLAGIDLDWEYPGSSRDGDEEDRGNEYAGVIFDGLSNSNAQIADRNNFTLLLQEMRAAFDEAFPDDHKLITFCASSGGSSYIEFNVVQDVVDRINIMNYDGAGSWSNAIAHHTSPSMITSSLNTFLGNGTYYRGIDPAKLNIGAATYTRGWKLRLNGTTGTNSLADGGGEAQFRALKSGPDLDLRTNNALNVADPGTTNQLRIFGATVSSSDALPEGICWKHIVDYSEDEGWITWHDPTQGGVITFNNNPDSPYYLYVLSYDDLETVAAKAAILQNRGAAGVIFWSALGDCVDPDLNLARAFALDLGIPQREPVDTRVYAHVGVGAASDVSALGGLAEYDISLGGESVVTLELEFEVNDGDLLAFAYLDTFEGFAAMDAGAGGGPVAWSPLEGGKWKGTLTLTYTAGGDTYGYFADPAEIIAKLYYTAKAIGDASMKLTGVNVYGIKGEGAPVTLLSAEVDAAEAVTSIVKVYSKYDLNKDDAVDALDLSIVALYCQYNEGDPEWDSLVKTVDIFKEGITPNMCDLNGDGTVDMLDLVDLYLHYTK